MSDKQDILATSLVNGNEKDRGDGTNNEPNAQSDHEQEHDPHFDPIISLPEVALPTLEEEEIELIKLRAKLFRYDTHENPPEWKERGTGDVKLLRHKETNAVRVLMRRDKTLKICANHFVTPFMELKPNCGSDRAWVWSVIADFADETVKPELLAIRFANADNAKKWKDAFEDAKHIVATKCKIYSESHENEEDTEDEEEEKDEEESFKEAIENVKEANNEEDDEVKDKITKEATEALENLKINTADVSSTSATVVENKS